MAWISCRPPLMRFERDRYRRAAGIDIAGHLPLFAKIIHNIRRDRPVKCNTFELLMDSKTAAVPNKSVRGRMFVRGGRVYRGPKASDSVRARLVIRIGKSDRHKRGEQKKAKQKTFVPAKKRLNIAQGAIRNKGKFVEEIKVVGVNGEQVRFAPQMDWGRFASWCRDNKISYSIDPNHNNKLFPAVVVPDSTDRMIIWATFRG